MRLCLSLQDIKYCLILGANTNTAVLTTMNDAAKALKKANADLDVDKVHDMMDDIAEQQDVAKEISEAISNPVAFGQVAFYIERNRVQNSQMIPGV